MIVVAAGLIERDGKLLITRRPRGKHGALQWEFPGGKLERDEDPKECLIREIKEELDIVIEVGSIAEVIFHKYPEKSVLLLFYHCRWISGEPRAIDCDAFEWTSPDRLPDYDFLAADLDFIQKLSGRNV
jgi:8-oxo-dGTP diphosphatase